MQRRYLIIIVAILALLLVIGIPAFLLLNGGSSSNTTPNGAATPTASAPAPTQTTVGVGQGALTAEAGDTIITLKWQPMAGAVSYNVYRDGSKTPLNADPLNATQYEDVGLTNTRTYTYTVAPVDSAGKVGLPLPAIQATAGAK